MPGFHRYADYPERSFIDNHRIQLGLLKNMFYLKDLNYGNYSLDDNRELAVVDFEVISILFVSFKSRIEMLFDVLN